MTSPIFVSRDGLARLTERLERLKAEWRALCDERTTAYELCGDGWHDNPYLNQLQQQEARKTHDIAELEQQLQRAQVVTTADGARPLDKVALGAIVRVLKTSASGVEQELVFEVVGWGESDRARARVAYNAPLVQPLIGLAVGDEIETGEGRAAVVTTVLELLPEWPARSASAEPHAPTSEVA